MTARRDWFARHLFIDWVLPGLLCAITACLGHFLDWSTPESGTRLALYGAVAGFAGLTLTASIFACTMTYESTNFIMAAVRDNSSNLLTKSWRSIFSLLLISGAGSVALFFVDGPAPYLAPILAAGLLAADVLAAWRAVTWLLLTFQTSETASAFADPSEEWALPEPAQPSA